MIPGSVFLRFFQREQRKGVPFSLCTVYNNLYIQNWGVLPLTVGIAFCFHLERMNLT